MLLCMCSCFGVCFWDRMKEALHLGCRHNPFHEFNIAIFHWPPWKKQKLLLPPLKPTRQYSYCLRRWKSFEPRQPPGLRPWPAARAAPLPPGALPVRRPEGRLRLRRIPANHFLPWHLDFLGVDFLRVPLPAAGGMMAQFQLI